MNFQFSHSTNSGRAIFPFDKLRLGNFRIKHLVLVLIILLAAGLRFYQLGTNPPSLDWDEASLGYNAYSLLKTGKDEFGRVWPISIRSFEDYKPALYAYVTIPSVAFFGLTEFAVRLPSAIFGTLTVVVIFFLVRELLRPIFISENQQILLALLTALFLAISPWHIQFSRVAFESNVAVFWVCLGLWLFLKSVISGKGRFWIASTVSFALSLYTYHSPRLVVPLLLLGLAIYFRKNLYKQKRWLIISIICGLVLVLPLFKELVSTGRARFNSVTALTSAALDESISKIEFDKSQADRLGALLHNRRLIYLVAVVKGYLDHFNLDFLFLTGDSPPRHHAVDMGMLLLWSAPFILVGVLELVKRKGTFPIFWWFLVSPVASSITIGTPHAVRSLLFAPVYMLFTALGLWSVVRLIRQKSFTPRRLIQFILTALLFINLVYYLQTYFVHTPVETASEWQYGYKEAVAEVLAELGSVERVVFTYAYDQPHIYLLFYGKVDPAWYQSQWHGEEILRDIRVFGKYEFRKINWEKDKTLQNVLFVGTPQEIPAAVPAFREIRFPNGEIAFRIVRR